MAPIKIINHEGEVADVYNNLPHEDETHYRERLRLQYERDKEVFASGYIKGVLDVCLRLMISGSVIVAISLIAFLMGSAFASGPMIAGLAIMLAGLLAGLASIG
jgi:hypothetical protein